MLYPAPQIRLYFHDNNGHPLSGGSVSTYLSSSSMPIQTAKDYKGKVKNPTTVPLDERGEAIVFLSPGIVYRIVVRDRLGATILDQDGISLPISGTDSGITYEFQSSDGSISIEATTEDGLITYDFTVSTKPLNLSFTPAGSQQTVKLSYEPATGADWSIKNLTITQDGKELGEYSPMSSAQTIDIPKSGVDPYIFNSTTSTVAEVNEALTAGRPILSGSGATLTEYSGSISSGYPTLVRTTQDGTIVSWNWTDGAWVMTSRAPTGTNKAEYFSTGSDSNTVEGPFTARRNDSSTTGLTSKLLDANGGNIGYLVPSIGNGTNGQVLTTNGQTHFYWADPTGGSGTDDHKVSAASGTTAGFLSEVLTTDAPIQHKVDGDKFVIYQDPIEASPKSMIMTPPTDCITDVLSAMPEGGTSGTYFGMIGHVFTVDNYYIPKPSDWFEVVSINTQGSSALTLFRTAFYEYSAGKLTLVAVSGNFAPAMNSSTGLQMSQCAYVNPDCNILKPSKLYYAFIACDQSALQIAGINASTFNMFNPPPTANLLYIPISRDFTTTLKTLTVNGSSVTDADGNSISFKEGAGKRFIAMTRTVG